MECGSSITKVNGMVVVTQVFPAAENRDTAGPDPGMRDPHGPESPVYNPVKVSEMAAAFLRGQPQSLGIAQIFVGLLCATSGLIGLLAPSLMMSLPLIASVVFVVSGSVAVAARRGTDVAMIRATLGVHVLSALVSLAGTLFLGWLLATQAYQPQLCPETGPSEKCHTMLWSLQNVLRGVWALVLVLTVSEFCIAVSLCVFSGLALRTSKPYKGHMVVVETGDYPPRSESTVALLGPAEMDEPSP
ncbi:unnamed protein product [Lota lota]